MAWNFRRSKKIFPGVRINLSKTGIGFSAGVRGARISRSPKGRVTGSVGIPGSGLSYRETLNSRKKLSNSTKGFEVSQNEQNNSSAARIFGWIFAIIFIYFGFISISSDLFSAALSFIIGITILIILRRSKNKQKQNNEIATDDEVLFPNSKYTNEPKTVKDWKIVNDEFEELLRLLICVKEEKSDKKNAPSFPVDKKEVVFIQSGVTLTDYEESEPFDNGTAYLTSKRIVFLGSRKTEQWNLDSITSPLPFDEKRLLIIQSLEHPDVLGFKFSSVDKYLTFSFNALSVFAARDKLDDLIESTKKSIEEYKKLKPNEK